MTHMGPRLRPVRYVKSAREGRSSIRCTLEVSTFGTLSRERGVCISQPGLAARPSGRVQGATLFHSGVTGGTDGIGSPSTPIPVRPRRNALCSDPPNLPGPPTKGHRRHGYGRARARPATVCLERDIGVVAAHSAQSLLGHNSKEEFVEVLWQPGAGTHHSGSGPTAGPGSGVPESCSHSPSPAIPWNGQLLGREGQGSWLSANPHDFPVRAAQLRRTAGARGLGPGGGPMDCQVAGSALSTRAERIPQSLPRTRSLSHARD